ncbi:hypothetical protein VM1G_09993 [Cytospora mali]|uniref:Uncharacterized protein n=1 Tax=Cytospora mali TaxID=578113 RepID=A0A194WD02_CYTMA|nr:hypothetical protein VM1G_09993 [Valsa mali]
MPSCQKQQEVAAVADLSEGDPYLKISYLKRGLVNFGHEHHHPTKNREIILGAIVEGINPRALRPSSCSELEDGVVD